jgi:peptidoglycan/LPS O-acetylase OafA/YrhL
MSRPGRLDSLDALRGVAALVVVLWHWQHFFYVGSTLGTIPPPGYPLVSLLFPFYGHGEVAVDLFFSLSGFIFYWLYAESIGSKAVSAGRFFILRFSRLYPLHLLTLLLVAVLQVVYRHGGHGDFVYPANTSSNFVINLLFIPAWVSRGFSFNAPVWSVSVEVFLYGLFFVLCRFMPLSVVTLAAASIFGMLGVPRFPALLGRGMISFFAGGIAALIYARVVSRPDSRRWSLIVVGVTALAAVALLVGIELDMMRFVARETIRKTAVLSLFPASVLSLALLERTFGWRLHRLGVLGDISYAVYLWHFPLQLVTVLLVDRLGISRHVFTNPLTLLAFFIALISVGYASVYGFERPAQSFLRSLLLPASKTKRG